MSEATKRPWAELIEELRLHNAIAITHREYDAALALAEAVLADHEFTGDYMGLKESCDCELCKLARDFQRLAGVK